SGVNTIEKRNKREAARATDGVRLIVDAAPAREPTPCNRLTRPERAEREFPGRRRDAVPAGARPLPAAGPAWSSSAGRFLPPLRASLPTYTWTGPAPRGSRRPP